MTMPHAAVTEMLAAPWVLGPVTFGAPAMLWGALAAGGPVLIHLMLRNKARRMPLPTVRFVIKTQRRTQAWQRLKHILLLLLRILAILLLVAVLARPTLETAALSAGSRRPVAAVFCLDDSASMGYRNENVTRFERARGLAVRALRDRDRFPPGSTLALLTGSTPVGATRLSLDVDYIRQRVEQLEGGEHDRGVGGMIEHAYRLLDEADLPAREIYVFGDLTRQAWRDVPVGAYAERSGVQVFCVDVGVEEPVNVAVLDPVLPDRTVSAGATVRVRFGLQVTGARQPRSLEVALDGKPYWRLGRVAPEQAERSFQVELAKLAPGLHQGEIRLRPEDPLRADDVRYFSLHVGSLPKVLVVGESTSPVAAVVSAMIAPADLPANRQRTELTQVAPADLARVEDFSTFLAVLLADVASVPRAVAGGLVRYVTGGGLLMVVPGPALDPAGYAEAEGSLAAVPAEVVVPDKPVHIAPPDKPHPWVARFQDGSGLSLSEPSVRRYLRFGELLEGAQVLAAMDDGAPAIVVRQIGRGRSTVLAFSPVREWSDFAVDAGPLLVLLHAALTEAMPRSAGAWNLRVGERAAIPLPRGVQDGVPATGQDQTGVAAGQDGAGVAFTVTSPTRRASWPAAVDRETRTLQPVTDRVGHYLIVREGDEAPSGIAYSVNTPAGESDLRRTPTEAIAACFPPDSVRCVRDLDELRGADESQVAMHALGGWLALVLLALMIAESFLSNRFHRAPASEEPGAPAQGPPTSA